MKFRKKPVEIDAVQFSGGNFSEVMDSFPEAKNWSGYLTEEKMWCLEIPTLEGTMTAQDGDWIIKGVKGEHYPCKPDIFEQTYDPVEGSDD